MWLQKMLEVNPQNRLGETVWPRSSFRFSDTIKRRTKEKWREAQRRSSTKKSLPGFGGRAPITLPGKSYARCGGLSLVRCGFLFELPPTPTETLLVLIIAVPLRTAARRKAGEHATAATAPICKALLPSYCTFFLPLGSLSSCFRAAHQSATHPLQRFAAYAAALRGPGL